VQTVALSATTSLGGYTSFTYGGYSSSNINVATERISEVQSIVFTGPVAIGGDYKIKYKSESTATLIPGPEHVAEKQVVTMSAAAPNLGGTFTLGFGGSNTESLSAGSSVILEKQVITLSGSEALGGTFTVKYAGSTTTPLAAGFSNEVQKITVNASSNFHGTYYLKQGDTPSLPLLSNAIREVQKLTIDGSAPLEGSFFLTFDGEITHSIFLSNATVMDSIKSNLEKMSKISSIKISRGKPSQFGYTFSITFDYDTTDVPLLQVNSNIAYAKRENVQKMQVLCPKKSDGSFRLSYGGDMTTALLLEDVHEVQTIKFSGASTLGGSVLISYDGVNSASFSVASMTPKSLSNTLLGLSSIKCNVTVSRTNTMVDHGYTWSVTFLSSSGNMLPISVNKATLNEVQVITTSGIGSLSGSITLAYKGSTTVSLNCASLSASDLQLALHQLPTTPNSGIQVARSGPINNGYKYSITFPSSMGDVQELSFTGSITANRNEVQKLVTSGNGVLGGSIKILYGGHSTAPISLHGLTAASLSTALNALSSIGSTSVTRGESKNNGYTYLITFTSNEGNVFLLQTDTAHMTSGGISGGGATVEVITDGLQQAGSIEISTEQQGSLGISPGGASIIVTEIRRGEKKTQASEMKSALEDLPMLDSLTVQEKGEYYDISFQKFGRSLTIDTLQLIEAHTSKVPEIQTLTVSGSSISGTYALAYQGKETVPLNAGSTYVKEQQVVTIDGTANLQGYFQLSFGGKISSHLAVSPVSSSEVQRISFSSTSTLGGFFRIKHLNVDSAPLPIASAFTPNIQRVSTSGYGALGGSFALCTDMGCTSSMELRTNIEIQEIVISGTSTLSGTFKLTYKGSSTTAIDVGKWSADDIKNSLNALSTITLVSVSRSMDQENNGYTYSVSFVRDTATSMPLITVDTSYSYEIQVLRVLADDTLTSGSTFTLSFNGETTANLPALASNLQVADALNLLSSTSGTVTVSRTSELKDYGYSYSVTFAQVGDLPLLTANTGSMATTNSDKPGATINIYTSIHSNGLIENNSPGGNIAISRASVGLALRAEDMKQNLELLSDINSVSVSRTPMTNYGYDYDITFSGNAQAPTLKVKLSSVREIQVLSIQSGSSISGTFKLQAGTSTTPAITFATTLSALDLRDSIKMLDSISSVEVTRSSIINNGYKFSITFGAAEGNVPLLSIVDSTLSNGATIQISTHANGIIMPSHGGLSGANVTAKTLVAGGGAAAPADVKLALEAIPSIGKVQVSTGSPASNGYSYDITFLSNAGNQDMLSVVMSNVTDGASKGGSVLVSEITPGRGPASATELQTALESIPDIGSVSVEMSAIDSNFDYAYTVTFNDISGDVAELVEVTELLSGGNVAVSTFQPGSGAATAIEVQSALNKLSTIKDVKVTRSGPSGNAFIYTIMFPSGQGDATMITPQTSLVSGGGTVTSAIFQYEYGTSCSIKLSQSITGLYEEANIFVEEVRKPKAASTSTEIKTALEHIGSAVGTVQVSEPIYQSAFVFSYMVTFSSIQEDMPLLQPASDYVQEVQVLTTSGSTVIAGSMTISYGFTVPTKTVNINVEDLSAASLKSSLETLGEISSVSVTRGALTNFGYAYTITFLTEIGDLVPLSVDTSLLSVGSLVSVSEAVKGSGLFQSNGLPVLTESLETIKGGSLSAAELKLALEALPRISKVSVTRGTVIQDHGFSYTVTFDANGGDVPLMVVDASSTTQGSKDGALIRCAEQVKGQGPASAWDVKIALEALSGLNSLTVSRNGPLNNGYTYTVTFDENSGNIAALSVNTASVTGSTPLIIVTDNVVQGEGASTASEVKEALESLSGISTVEVTRGSYSFNGYTYSVTFTSYDGDVEALTVDSSNLLINGVANPEAKVVINEITKGQYPSTATQVESILETMPSIIDVTVVRSDPIDKGFVYTITFNSLAASITKTEVTKGTVAVGATKEVQTLTTSGTGILSGSFALSLAEGLTQTSDLSASSNVIKEVQHIVLSGAGNLGGRFTLMLRGETTPYLNVASNTLADEIKSELEKFSSVGTVTVTKGSAVNNGHTYAVTFDTDLGDQSLIFANDNQVSQGGDEATREVQVISTFGHGFLAGSFTLSFLGKSTIKFNPSTLTAQQLKHALELLPTTGSVTVTRGPQQMNGYSYSVTFDANEGDLEMIKADTSLMSDGGNSGGHVSVKEFIKGGMAGGKITTLEHIRGVIPCSASEMKTALQTLPGINTVTVTQGILTNNGYTYAITFDDYAGDVPILVVSASKMVQISGDLPDLAFNKASLTGSSANIVVNEHAKGAQAVASTKERQRLRMLGTGLLEGFFAVSFEGETSFPIPVSATAAQVQAEIEKMPSIDKVEVLRSNPENNGYAYDISMEYSKGLTSIATQRQGVKAVIAVPEVQTIVVSSIGPLVGSLVVTRDGSSSASLTHPVSASDMETALNGLGSSVSVSRAFSSDNTYSYSVTFGQAAGDVAILSGALTGNVESYYVGNLNNLVPTFTSLTQGGVTGGNVAVSPFIDGVKPVIQVQEIQTITTSGIGALEGTFTVSYNGATTQALSASDSLSAATLKLAMEALPGIGTLTITKSSTKIDNGYTFSITFTTAGNIALLTIDSTNVLVAVTTWPEIVGGFTIPGGTIVVSELQKGVAGATQAYEVQKVTTSGTGTLGGEYTLTYGTDTTSGINPLCSQADLESILKSLASLADVTVTRDSALTDFGYTYTVTFLKIPSGSIAFKEVTKGVTAVTGVEEIQVASTMGDGTLFGTFALTYNGQTSSSLDVATASAAEVETALEKLDNVGDVTVSRGGQTQNGYPYSITFNTGNSNFDITEITAGVPNVNATKEVQEMRVQGSGTLGGYFTLSYGVNIYNVPYVTAALDPATLTASQLKEALEKLPSIGGVSITRSAEQIQNGYIYTITFDTERGNLPLIKSDVSGMSQGGQISVREIQFVYLFANSDDLGGTFRLTFSGQQTEAVAAGSSIILEEQIMVTSGIGMLGGTFRLQFGTEWTAPLDPRTLSAQILQDNLQALSGLGRVGVSRTNVMSNNGFTYIISFDTSVDIPMLGVDKSLMTEAGVAGGKVIFQEKTKGSGAASQKDIERAMEKLSNIADIAVLATSFGNGIKYTLTYDGNWNKGDVPLVTIDVSQMTGNGAGGRTEESLPGISGGDVTIFEVAKGVQAIAARKEVQKLTVSGDGFLDGTFKLQLNGATTSALSANTATQDEVQAALLSIGQSALVSRGARSNNGYVYTITFANEGKNLPLLTVDKSDVTQGNGDIATLSGISNILVSKGDLTALTIDVTRVSQAKGDLGLIKTDVTKMSVGLCHPTTPPTILVKFVQPQSGDLPAMKSWELENRLLLSSQSSGEGYLVVTDNVVMGTRNNAIKIGAVYIFTGSEESGYNEQEKIIPNSLEQGSNFGYSVSIYQETIVVGAPEVTGIASSEGKIFIFKRSGAKWTQSREYALSDTVLTPKPELMKNRRFGHSVTIWENTIAVGELQINRPWDHKGGVTIFKRDSSMGSFSLFQQVNPGDAGKVGDNFGSTVSLHENTLAIGSQRNDDAGVDAGSVYIFTRANTGSSFFLQQKLTSVDARPGDMFGRSVGIFENTLVVSAHEHFSGLYKTGKHIQLIKTYASKGATLGSSFRLTWNLIQQKTERDAGYLPIGTRVFAIINKGSNYQPGSVTRSPLSVANMGLSYAVQFDSGYWEPNVKPYNLFPMEDSMPQSDKRQHMQQRVTRDIPINIESSNLKLLLQNDLGTGRLLVSRSGPNTENGYEWTITFLDNESPSEFVPDISLLSGVGAGCTVSTVSKPNREFRGYGTVFKREGSKWTEQARLAPNIKQKSDLFGMGGVAIYGQYTGFGAPNRDAAIPGRNSGASYAFDLSFLNLKFEKLNVAVMENAGQAQLRVLKCSPQCHLTTVHPEHIIQYQIGDGSNSANGLPTISVSPQKNIAGGTCSFKNGCAGTATGRTDCHLRSYAFKDECLYLGSDSGINDNADFDHQGISDFAPDKGQILINASQSIGNVNVIITNDMHNEVPDETINVRLLSPGYEPSFGGDLWAEVTITDDGDGGYGTQNYYEKFSKPTESESFDGFGSSVSLSTYTTKIGAVQTYAAAGLPNAKRGNIEGAGKAFVYSLASGMWSKDSELMPASNSKAYTTKFAHFGASISAHSNTLVVGAPGVFEVYVFSITNGAWAQETILSATNSLLGRPFLINDQFAEINCLAIHKNSVVVGAPGAERAFVYKRVFVGDPEEVTLVTWAEADDISGSMTLSFDGKSTSLNAVATADEVRHSMEKLVTAPEVQTITYSGKGPLYGYFKILYSGAESAQLDPSVTYEVQKITTSGTGELGGSFYLSYGGERTRMIELVKDEQDLDSASLKTILEDLTGITSITTINTSPKTQNGYTYSITFGDPGNLHELVAVTAAKEVQTITTSGTGALGGHFTISIGIEKTAVMEATVTAAGLDSALEALPGISSVEVSRSSIANNGYTYSVTFDDLKDIGLMIAQRKQAEIQTLVFSGSAQISGTFQLRFKGQVTAQLDPQDMTAVQLANAINSLSSVSSVGVSRGAFASFGYTYSVTFFDEGDQPQIEVAAETLTNGNVQVTTISNGYFFSESGAAGGSIVTSTITGGFSITQGGSAGGSVSVSTVTNGNMLTASEMKSAIELLPTIGTVDVTRGPLQNYGFTYSITFQPIFEVQTVTTSGSGALSGTVTLTYNGSTTDTLNPTCTASEMEIALEKLNTITAVTVSRSGLVNNGYTYSITYLDQSKKSDTSSTFKKEVQSITTSGLQSLTGNMFIEFQGFTTSALDIATVTASEMENELNSLESIVSVSVSKSKYMFKYGFTWSITFSQDGNLPEMTVTKPSNVNVDLKTITEGSGKQQLIPNMLSMLDGGSTGGKVIVRTALIEQNTGDLELISINSNGLYVLREEQALTISAPGTMLGTWKAGFMGQYTTPLNPGISSSDLKTELDKISTVGSVSVGTRESNGNGYIYPITFNENPGDIPFMVADFSDLYVVKEVQTVQVSGSGPLSGSWAVTFGGEKTGGMAVDISSYNLQTELNLMSTVGKVEVGTRQSATNSYSYPITFLSKFGDIEALIGDTSNLHVTKEVQTVTTSGSGSLQGSWKLSYGGSTTGSLPPLATNEEVKSALEALPTLGLVTVVTSATANNGKTYRITFDQNAGDLALLTADVHKFVVTKEVQHVTTSGATTLQGSWKLSFMGHATTALPTDASTSALKSALEVLPNINQVTVTASSESNNGRTYSITFDSNSGNLDALVSYTSELHVDREIQRVTLSGSDKVGGFFTLSYSGQTTGFINVLYANSSTIKNALENLSNLGNVEVTSVSVSATSKTFDVKFMDNAGDLSLLTGDASSMTEGGRVFGDAQIKIIEVKKGVRGNVVVTQATAGVAGAISILQATQGVAGVISTVENTKGSSATYSISETVKGIESTSSVTEQTKGFVSDSFTVSRSAKINNGYKYVITFPASTGDVGAVSVSTVSTSGTNVNASVSWTGGSQNSPSWSLEASLNASNYFDTEILDNKYIEHMSFGASVDIWEETIAIGAPSADFNHVKRIDSYGRPIDNSAYGRGAVYVFLNHDGKWMEQTIIQPSDKQASDKFGASLDLDGDQLIIGASSDDFQARTSWDFEMGALVGWTATGTAFAHQPTLGDNSKHRTSYGRVIGTGASVLGPSGAGGFRVSRAHTGIDCSNGPCKYWDSIAPASQVDGIFSELNQRRPATVYSGHVSTTSVVTSHYSDADFRKIEQSWADSADRYTSTTLHRTHQFIEKGEAPQPAVNEGHYYIGTFEKRNLETLPRGNTQGDAPQGTLTSEPFAIEGNSISFLIGGGCDIQTEYIELLIDGQSGFFKSRKQPFSDGLDKGHLPYSTLRATGKCNEKMDRVTWDTTPFIGKAGQIKIVDASSAQWAHINIDDIKFSWNVITTSRANADGVEPCREGQCRLNSGVDAGAAYVFRRHDPVRFRTVNDIKLKEPCSKVCTPIGGCTWTSPANRWPCKWQQQAKLLPTDRRANEHFGHAVAIDDAEGVAVIGAPLARCVDQYNRNQGVARGDTDRQTGEFIARPCGSAYVYERIAEYRDGTAALLAEPFWHSSEAGKVQPFDKQVFGRFGTSVALEGRASLVGSPHEEMDFNVAGGEKLFIIDTDFHKLSFTKSEYYIIEDAVSTSDPDFVLVTITRTGDLSKTLHVGYATSDITAIGVSSGMFAHCQGNVKTDKGECGDYRHTSGIMTFLPSVDLGIISIPIIDDFCPEPFSEWFRVQLFLPGGDALIGDRYSTVVRIDDEDFNFPTRTFSSIFCRRKLSEYATNNDQYRGKTY
jgi:hypothetical protein